MVERGAVTKSCKGKKTSVEKKMGECCQWKANGQGLEGDSSSFRHEQAAGNRCESMGRPGSNGKD